MFTLLVLVQKQFSLNRKVCVAFIEFSINRKLLWSVLLKNGINGNCIVALKACKTALKSELDVDLIRLTTLTVRLG